MLRFPDKQLTVCVLANNPFYDVEGLSRKIADRYLGTDASPPPSGMPARANDWRAYIGKYLDRITGRVREIVDENGILTLRSGGKNYALNALGGAKFVIPPDGTSITFSEAPLGTVQMRLLASGAVETRSSRIEPSTKMTRAAADYVGTYFSAELPASWTISLKGGVLGVRGKGVDALLAPLDADEFSFDGMLIRFFRKGNRAIAGFYLSNVRDTNLRFDRSGGHVRREAS
jgi:hypothetical protein